MTERTLAFLRDLPEVAPPADLWTRIERVHSRRRWARRGLALAAAAVVVLGVFAAFRPAGFATRDLAVADSRQTPASVDNFIARSHALETDLAAVRTPAGPAARSLESELARVDSDLSRAYARRADESEIGDLWRARVDALESLVAVHRHPDAIRL